MLNWIDWNKTIYIKIDLALNNLQRLVCHKTQPTNIKNLKILMEIQMDQFAVKNWINDIFTQIHLYWSLTS